MWPIVLLVGVMLATLVAMFVYLKRYWLISGTPTSTIASAHQGYVELIGHICDTTELLVAPLTGRHCVWYQCSVHRVGEEKKSAVYHTRSSAPFLINDGSGECLVYPEGAKIDAEHSRSWHGNSAIPGTTSPFSYLDQIISPNGSDGRNFRYQEAVLLPHEKLYALGQFSSRGGGRHLPNVTELKGAIIRQWKSDYAQLLKRFDRDDNQQIDMNEWAEVEKAAEQEAKRQRRLISQQPTQHCLNQPAESSHPFLLSTYDEQRIGRNYAWRAALAALAWLVELGVLVYMLA